MVALKPDTHVLLDGAVKVYKRGNSRCESRRQNDHRNGLMI